MYIFDVNWSARTAGPSPYRNERTELFLLGCHKARSGNPCKGCFNAATWQLPADATAYDPIWCAEHLIRHAPNRFVTIGGGEPTDQIEDLILMCQLLQAKGFHVLCYTWHDFLQAIQGEYGETFKHQFLKLFEVIDGFIDGEFILEQRCYQAEKNDGLFNSIGSTNQHLVIKEKGIIKAYPVSEITKITFNQLTEEMTVQGRGLNYGAL